MSKKKVSSKSLAENRKARYNYEIGETLECGLVLVGSEVKSLRDSGGLIAESYASIEEGELWLINCYIPLHSNSKTFGHEERRRRKLLINKKQLKKLWVNLTRERMTLIPLKLYLNEKGKVKLLIGIAKGKKVVDKRQTEKKRDWQREKSRLLKQIKYKDARTNFTMKSAAAILTQKGVSMGKKFNSADASFAHATSFCGSINTNVAENAIEKNINVSRAEPIVDDTKGGTHHLNFLKK